MTERWTDNNYEYKRITDELASTKKGGVLKSYMKYAVGSGSFWDFLAYEIIMGAFAFLPGSIGYLLRRKSYKHILRRIGRGVTIGKNVSIRGPKKVELGRNVIIGDNCSLDARASGSRIVIDDNVIIAGGTAIRTRGEEIIIREGTSIGSNCIIGTDSRIVIGKDVLIAAFCYLSGGGSHNFNDLTIPIIKQGVTRKGGITVGDGAWIGAHTVINDGANIGAGAIIGTNSFVNKDILPLVIAFGSPAKVYKKRGE